MQWVRKPFLTLLALLLPVLLFATTIDVGALRVFGSPEPVKNTLAKSGIYNSAISNTLEQTQNITVDDTEIPLTDPAVKSAAEATFTPQFVHQSTDKVIDSVYDWLEGKTQQPDFKIDLSAKKADFAQNVGSAAEQKARTLPVCTSVASAQTSNPFSASCLPPGVTPGQVGAEAKNAVLNGQGFLDNPVITSATVKSSDSNQPIFSGELKNLPAKYQRAKKTPVILVLLTVGVIAAIIFLSGTKRKGLRRVGVILLGVGALILLFTWVINQIVDHRSVSNVSVDSLALQSSVKTLVSDLTHKISQSYWWFGGGYIVLGLLAIAGAQFIKNSGADATKVEADTAAPTAKNQ